jgi:hypothetical protein
MTADSPDHRDDRPIPNRLWRRRGKTPEAMREARLARDREAYRIKRLLDGRTYTPRLDWRRP